MFDLVMFSLHQTLFIAAALIVLIRLVLILPEQKFAQQLLSAGIRWSPLGTAHLLDIKQGMLWQLYLWSFRWRRVQDLSLRRRCARWLIVGSILIAAFVGLLIEMGIR